MTAVDVEALAAQVQYLVDRDAIWDCVYRYARGLDRHDPDVLASPFHEDAIDKHGDFVGGRDEFVEWGLELLSSQWDAHTHFMTNNRVEIDGDVAHSEIYVQVVLRRKEGPLDICGGRYVDRLERRNGKWAIAARLCLVEWRTEAESQFKGAAVDFVSLVGTVARDGTDSSYDRPLVVKRAP